MSCFLYSYVHNAPDDDFYPKTHAPFFQVIRQANPTVPIIIFNRPDYYHIQAYKIRRDIASKTYGNAIMSGDNYTYFVEGETLFGECDREFCSVDGLHSNDL